MEVQVLGLRCQVLGYSEPLTTANTTFNNLSH
jgi:hypothetical protein